ncbi:MAG TPA: alpha/beta fold hydrolase, partial [Vicinamibacteria bacterium]
MKGFRGLAVLWLATAEAQEWNRFRGPNGSGIADTTGLPIEFGPEANVVWKTMLPPGHSSPVLTEDLIFLTAVEGEELLTICLDRRAGNILWQRRAPRERSEKLDRRNSPASPTPATDGDAVYVFFGDFGLLAYEADGKERWRLPLGPFDNAYGMGSSPIVVDDTVVLVCDQANGSFMIAVSKGDGRTRFRTDRSEYKTGHSTPVVYRPPAGPAQLLVPGSFRLTSYSLDRGEPLWWVSGLAFEMKATPVLDGDVVFIHGTSGDQAIVPPFESVLPAFDADGDGRLSRDESANDRVRWFGLMDLDRDGFLDSAEWSYYQAARATRGGLYSYTIGGKGDMTESSFRWHYGKAVPQLPSSLLYQGVLHTVDDAGVVTSFEPSSGRVLNQARLEGVADNFFASPVAADGKIFMVSESGKVAVLKPDGSLELLAVNDLGERSYATPAIADGRIYIRTETSLFSFGRPEMPRSSGIHELVLERPNEKPLRYGLSLPKKPKAGAPLVLALHYAGHGAPYYGKGMLESLIEPALRDLGAVIVAPDCPSSSWSTAESEKAVLALLALVSESYQTDPERVVVTGYSMGGMGTWYLVARHPDRFSAAIPMAGSPRDADLDAVASTPLYAIHSRIDEVVPLPPTEDAVSRLKQAGARAELVVVVVPHYESASFLPHLKKAIPWLRDTWEA